MRWQTSARVPRLKTPVIPTRPQSLPTACICSVVAESMTMTHGTGGFAGGRLGEADGLKHLRLQCGIEGRKLLGDLLGHGLRHVVTHALHGLRLNRDGGGLSGDGHRLRCGLHRSRRLHGLRLCWLVVSRLRLVLLLVGVKLALHGIDAALVLRKLVRPGDCLSEVERLEEPHLRLLVELPEFLSLERVPVGRDLAAAVLKLLLAVLHVRGLVEPLRVSDCLVGNDVGEKTRDLLIVLAKGVLLLALAGLVGLLLDRLDSPDRALDLVADGVAAALEGVERSQVLALHGLAALVNLLGQTVEILPRVGARPDVLGVVGRRLPSLVVLEDGVNACLKRVEVRADVAGERVNGEVLRVLLDDLRLDLDRPSLLKGGDDLRLLHALRVDAALLGLCPELRHRHVLIAHSLTSMFGSISGR